MNKFIVLIITSLLSISVIAAPQFAVTVEHGVYRFDYAGDKQTDITALQFDIQLPDGITKRDLDISNCVSALPRSHIGACNIANGKLRVIVYSNANALLPDTSIGTIKLLGAANARRSSPSLMLREDRSIDKRKSLSSSSVVPNSSMLQGNLLQASNLLYATIAAEDLPGDVLQ